MTRTRGLFSTKQHALRAHSLLRFRYCFATYIIIAGHFNHTSIYMPTSLNTSNSVYLLLFRNSIDYCAKVDLVSCVLCHLKQASLVRSKQFLSNEYLLFLYNSKTYLFLSTEKCTSYKERARSVKPFNRMLYFRVNLLLSM